MTKEKKRIKSLHEAALSVLKEAALGPGVAHQDPPQKLNPTDGPAKGSIEDGQNTNNVRPENIGKKTGQNADNKSMGPETKKITPADGGEHGQGENQDLGASLTNAEQDKTPAAKAADGISRTSKVPGGNYPAQEKFNPDGKKIFAEGENPFAKKDDDKDDDDDSDKDDSDDDDKDEKKGECDESTDDQEESVEEAYEPMIPEDAVRASVDGINIDEHMDALFSNDGNLSESFKGNALTVFKAALFEATKNVYSILDEQYQAALAEATQAFENNLSEEVDTYLGYIVEQWVAENEVAIESGLRTELTEDVMSGIRKVFVENNIDIPENKVDVVEQLLEKVENLETKLSEEFENSVRLRKEIVESKKVEIFQSVTKGLTDVQADKLKGLAESVAFSDPSEYETKLNTLKESYMTTSVKAPINSGKTLDNDAVTVGKDGKLLAEDKVETRSHDSRVLAAAAALGRTVKPSVQRKAN